MKKHKIQSYAPLPDCVTIKKSKLHGLGLFATKDIPKGHDLGMTHINDDRFPDGYIRVPLGGFTNYSTEPNCVFVEDGGIWRLETLKPIKKGEEITADYQGYDEAVLATYN